MPVLALAGGTSATLGRAITLAVLSLSPSEVKSETIDDPNTSEDKIQVDRAVNDTDVEEWSVRILTRSTSHVPLWLQKLSTTSPSQDSPFTHPRIHLEAVDYASHASLTAALQGVHTLISLLFNPSPLPNKQQSEREIALLRAAVSAGVKRFAPTAWGLPGLYWDGRPGDGGNGGGARLEGLNAGVWEECAGAMARGEIECARFNCGVFMNYLAWGCIGPDVEKGQKGQQWVNGYQQGVDELTEGVGRHGDMFDGSGSTLLSLKNGLAELPVKDNGSWPSVTMTTIRDVGKLVASALLIPLGKWNKYMSMAGDTINLGDLIEIAEKIGGKKIDVRKVEKQDLVQRLQDVSKDEKKYVGALWLQFKILYCDDQEGKGWLRPTVNELCPNVKTESVQDFLNRCWHAR